MRLRVFSQGQLLADSRAFSDSGLDLRQAPNRGAYRALVWLLSEPGLRLQGFDFRVPGPGKVNAFVPLSPARVRTEGGLAKKAAVALRGQRRLLRGRHGLGQNALLEVCIVDDAIVVKVKSPQERNNFLVVRDQPELSQEALHFLEPDLILVVPVKLREERLDLDTRALKQGQLLLLQLHHQLNLPSSRWWVSATVYE